MSSPDPLGRSAPRRWRIWQPRLPARASAGLASGGDNAGISATATWARSDGIDILGGGTGDRDGFENVTLEPQAASRASATSRSAAAGRYIHHDSRVRRHRSRHLRARRHARRSATETVAVRGWLGLRRRRPMRRGAPRVEVQHLDSENRNRIGDARPPTASAGERASAVRSRAVSRSARPARADRRDRAGGGGFRHPRPPVRRPRQPRPVARPHRLRRRVARAVGAIG